MSDTTERARPKRFVWKMEMFDGSGDVWENEYVYATDYDALAVELAAAEKRTDRMQESAKVIAGEGYRMTTAYARACSELAAAEKRNAELERRLAVLDSPHLFDAIRAITNLSQNDVELAIRAVRIAMDMAQAGHDAGVAALAAASEGKP